MVDNNSSDDTKGVFERFAAANNELPLRYIFEERQGLSYARNSAICGSEGDLIVVVDDDEVLEPQFLSSYLELFEDESVNCAGGRIVPEYEMGRPSWMNRFCESAIASPIDLGRAKRCFPSGAIPGGGNMAFRRSALDRYGVFDETLGRSGDRLFGGEESNLFARFRAGGERIFYSHSAVTHHFIPPHRVEREYLDRLWFGVGVSQMVRSRLESPRFGAFKALFAELCKWCATISIAAFYAITLQHSKGCYLLLMRRRISRGLLSAI